MVVAVLIFSLRVVALRKSRATNKSLRIAIFLESTIDKGGTAARAITAYGRKDFLRADTVEGVLGEEGLGKKFEEGVKRGNKGGKFTVVKVLSKGDFIDSVVNFARESKVN